MGIYLDACCYNRPFDDPDIDRNHLEAEAVVAILNHVQQGRWDLVASTALDLELKAAPQADRSDAVLGMLAAAKESITAGQAEYNRLVDLVALGFRRLDALHLACAESAQCQVFLTTDDQLLRKAAKNANRMHVGVRNP